MRVIISLGVPLKSFDKVVFLGIEPDRTGYFNFLARMRREEDNREILLTPYSIDDHIKVLSARGDLVTRMRLEQYLLACRAIRLASRSGLQTSSRFYG